MKSQANQNCVRDNECYKKGKQWSTSLLATSTFTMVMMVATLFAMFFIDIYGIARVTPKVDVAVYILHLIVFLLFGFEWIASVLFIDGCVRACVRGSLSRRFPHAHRSTRTGVSACISVALHAQPRAGTTPKTCFSGST